MTTPPSAPGPAPAPKNLLARLIGVLTSPRDTFASAVAPPKWFGMLALTTIVVAIFSALPLTRPEGRQAALDQQVEGMKAFGVTVNDQMYEQMEKGTARMPYTTGIGILVVSPIMAVIFSGILFAIFNAAMGGEASFKQVLTVLVHAGVISMLSAVLSGSVNYFRGSMTSVANVGALLPMLDQNSFLAHLLGTIDIFLVWHFVVLSIGLAVLYRRRTQPIAMSFLGLYAVVAVLIAVFKSRAGGA